MNIVREIDNEKSDIVSDLRVSQSALVQMALKTLTAIKEQSAEIIF